MAKAPNASGRQKAQAKTAPEPVEDAEVIEESPDASEDVAEAQDAQGETRADEPSVPETEKDSAAKPEADAEKSRDETGPHEKRRRGGGFLALLLGGAMAAVIGFAAARYVVPEGWPFPGVAPEEDPLVAVIDAQGKRIEALADRLAVLETDTARDDALADLSAETQRLDEEIAAEFTALAERVDSLADRLDAVERLAPEGSEAAQAAAAAYERELVALREMFEAELADLEAQQADVGQLEEDAAEAAQAAAGRTALARVVAALDTGQPFDEALAELQRVTEVEPPEALAEAGATGVPTLLELQEAFPPAARDALDAAIKAAVEDGSMGRMSAFLRNQLGTRSLEPREGDDPDAILSRAEAALKRGDIEGALSELDAMPEAAASALASWKEMAAARKSALDAGAALARALNAK
jgi:hypothetical protein